MQRKILVLGGGGFIGTHLVAALNQARHHVQVAGNNLNPPKGINADYLSGDLNSHLYQRCETPDLIFHLAGSASVACSLGDPNHDFHKTLPNLSALLHKMQTDWPQARLIYLSSAAVYGENASENTSVRCQLKPMSPYGLHKQLAEEMIQFYIRRYNISAQIVRPFSIYGEGLRKQLLWDALSKAQRGEFSYFGNGEQQRDWVYIHDFIDFLFDLMSQQLNKQNELLNAGTGEGISIKTLLTMLLRIAGYHQTPIFSSVGKPGDPDNLVSCREEQIFYPQLKQTSLQQGLERYASWFKQMGQS